ncbi:MAG: hypothetical protein MJZ25_01665 [Fibrobacter sp.]|nr:hypothetical protein [Fibrobacter sp.]
MSNQEQKFLINSIAAETIPMIVSDFGCPQEKAMDLLYNSKSYAALLNAATGLYFQSTAYFYEILRNELEHF